jgi:hypothetical protein
MSHLGKPTRKKRVTTKTSKMSNEEWAVKLLLKSLIAVNHKACCVAQDVNKNKMALSINGTVGPYFRNKRGVRQGDPISPLLFDFIVDALAMMLSKASEAGHI